MTARLDKIVTMNAAHSAQDALFELQVDQYHHDETYHREIARLSLHQRLNHMALHFAKYTGKVATADGLHVVFPVFVDVLIIALSTANILNIALWDIVAPDSREYPSLQTFGRALATEMNAEINDYSALVRATAAASGRVAAACEKIDHLEEIEFRAEIRHGIAALARLSLAVVAVHSVDPVDAVRSRLAKVKQRLKLHGRI